MGKILGPIFYNIVIVITNVSKRCLISFVKMHFKLGYVRLFIVSGTDYNPCCVQRKQKKNEN